MSTEPQISNRNVLASLYGAVYALFLPIGFMLLAGIFEVVSPPENPDNDGYLRAYATLFALMLPLFIVYFIYFLFISIKQNLSLKTLFFVSIITPFSIAFLTSTPFDESMSPSDFTPIILIPLFFAISLCIGSWGWYRAKKHNQMAKTRLNQQSSG